MWRREDRKRERFFIQQYVLIILVARGLGCSCQPCVQMHDTSMSKMSHGTLCYFQWQTCISIFISSLSSPAPSDGYFSYPSLNVPNYKIVLIELLDTSVMILCTSFGSAFCQHWISIYYEAYEKINEFLLHSPPLHEDSEMSFQCVGLFKKPINEKHWLPLMTLKTEASKQYSKSIPMKIHNYHLQLASA